MHLAPRSPAPRRSRRLRAVTAGLLSGALLALTGTSSAAQADVLYVPWSAYLSGWTDAYVPTSANDCVAGRPACVTQTLQELNRILKETGTSCGDHAVFALAYARITQTYAWSREIPGYYEDVRFANHQDAVFATYYTDAWTNWRNGNRAAVPGAWLTAFDASAAGRVTGMGDLLLGMNAHINRDLPYVLASVGLVAPDGSSRKPDFDKVEDFLAKASEPLIAEAAQRFDPSMDDTHDPLDVTYTLVMQVLSAGRENAWRNAEALVSAPTPEARGLVQAKIENDANAAARAILLAQSYLPPLTSSTARQWHCAAHNGDPAPLPYPFGTPSPYRT
jgi:Family of unknown function (DUF5995)